MCIGTVYTMTSEGNGISWGEILKTQGISTVLLLMILISGGYAAKRVYESVPMVLETIAEGYEKNSIQLEKAAAVFQSAAMENRKFIATIVEDFKEERLRDQQLMIELIRRGDIDSETVAEAMEAAHEVVPHQVN